VNTAHELIRHLSLNTLGSINRRAAIQSISIFSLASIGAAIGASVSVALDFGDMARALASVIAALILLVLATSGGLRQRRRLKGTSEVQRTRLLAAAWLCVGACLAGGLALSAASMRASPLGDMQSAGGIATKVGFGLLVLWAIVGFRKASRIGVGLTVLVSAFAVHLAATQILTAELESAEPLYAELAVKNALGYVGVGTTVVPLGQVSRHETTALGTLELLSVPSEGRYDLVWSRRSFVGQILNEDARAPIASYWAGIAESGKHNELQVRSAIAGRKSGSDILLRVMAEQGSRPVLAGTPVLVHRTSEPHLKPTEALLLQLAERAPPMLSIAAADVRLVPTSDRQ
jgi:hypothetical protein